MSKPTMTFLADGQTAFSMNAPDSVEGVLFSDDAWGIKIMGIMNICEGFHTPEVHDVEVTVRCAKPDRVCLLPAETKLPYV